jgi:hypothetical protein
VSVGSAPNNNADNPVMCGVDIDVPLRTAEAVFEVMPQERISTPGAKTSTFALGGEGESQWGMTRE